MAVGLVQRAIGFALLPFYARVLSPSDYGVVAVLLSIVGAAQFLLSFGLETSVFRGYFLYSGDVEKRERYLNSLGVFLLVVPVLIGGALALTFAVSGWSAGVAPGNLFALELLSAGIYVGASVMPLALVRAREDFGAYVRINATYAAAQIVVKATFVLGFGWGVRGWVLSDLVASVMMLLAAFLFSGHRWRKHVERRSVLGGLALGLPLLPHFMSHWVLSLSDRIVLGAMVTAHDVGLYSMGYQVGLLLGIVLNETNRAIMPSYGRAITSDEGRASLGPVATTQILMTALFGAATALLAPPVLHIAIPSSFYGAAAIVPSVALGYVLFGWYYVPMNTISLIAGDTKFVAIPTVIAAVANVGLNVWMVPHLGILAAGINTAVSYALLLSMVLIYFRVRIKYRIGLDWRRIHRGLLFLIGMYALVWFAGPENGWGAVFLRLGGIGVAVLVLFPDRVRRSNRVQNPAPSERVPLKQ